MFGYEKKPPKERIKASAVVYHIEGLLEWRYHEVTTIQALKLDNLLSIEGEKKKKVLLPFSQIEKVRIITWRKLRSRPASVAGRALVGGALGGDTGFLLGALSAQNDVVTKTVTLRNCLEIVYHPKDNPRLTQSLIFYDDDARYITEFTKFLCQFAHLPPPEIVGDEPQYL